MIEAIRGDEGDLIITHNHPGGGPLSDTDVISTIGTRNREIRACTPGGKTHSFTCPIEVREDPDLFSYLGEVGGEETEEMQRRVEERIKAEGLENQDRIGKEEVNETLLRVAGRFATDWRSKGVRYTIIESGGKRDSLFMDFYPRWDSSLGRFIRQ